MSKQRIGPHLPPAVRRQLSELGAMISIARKERGWTQSELGDRIGVGRMTVVRIEKGNAEVSAGGYLSAAWMLELPVLGWSEIGGTGSSTIGILLAGLTRGVPQRVKKAPE